ncbi:vomeronasal type-2 receptor 26-like [Elgaria multicarinata webbii]|uniref:vomeronasal type-2 receptor 26-like n=1 Tax=Elgaria multicarinata webbii TaxID=159646 RepID=UPI002FCD2DE4
MSDYLCVLLSLHRFFLQPSIAPGSLCSPISPATPTGTGVCDGNEEIESREKPGAAEQLPSALSLPLGCQLSFQEGAHEPSPGEDLLPPGNGGGIPEQMEPPSQESASKLVMGELTHPTIIKTSQEQCDIKVPAKGRGEENRADGQLPDATHSACAQEDPPHHLYPEVIVRESPAHFKKIHGQKWRLLERVKLGEIRVPSPEPCSGASNSSAPGDPGTLAFTKVFYKVHLGKCTISKPLPILHKYFQPGDFIIAGITSQIYIFSSSISFSHHPSHENIDDLEVLLQNYQHILLLEFAIKEINDNPYILPNITLGFHIYNNRFSATSTYRASVDLLSTQNRFIPNYKCDVQTNLVAVIGGPNSDIVLHMGDILGIYKIPQLTYGSAPVVNNNMRSIFFYQMFPKASLQYMGILKLLLHFRWRWIGVLYVNDDTGQRFIQTVLPMFTQSGICFDFIERCPKQSFSSEIEKMVVEVMAICRIIMSSTAKVLIVDGETGTMVMIRILMRVSEFENAPSKTKGKVWILTAQIDFTSFSFQRSWDIHFLHGAISFASHSKELLGFQKFLQMRTYTTNNKDSFMREFWEQAFSCSFPNSVVNREIETVCTGQEKLETLPGSVFETGITAHSYSIYNAVYAVAHALHAMHSSKLKHRSMRVPEHWTLWALHDFLKLVSFNNSAGEKVLFNRNRELVAGFDIINWITFPNHSFLRSKIGRIDPKLPQDKMFTIVENAIVWPSRFNQSQPLSLCNDNCFPGYRRAKREGKPFCCYDCLPCPEREISNQTDMDNCFQCLDDHYSTKDQDACIPKNISFLSYEEPIGIGLAMPAISFSVITAFVIWTFIKHQDTPIVKANNRDLTYTLLISLLLCFVSALLFIGQPQKVLCLFRQTAFAVIFSVAVSCVLAKTIIVVLAFITIKPGSRIRKWVGKQLGRTIVVPCSLVQGAICTVWLATSPPFPDFVMSALAEEIVLECNEGSAAMFFCVLGYLGFLSIISFAVAFLARKLPDTFNEAKFITFSMLVFCTVWLCFVPSYLSTKGKYTVAVEIFSIIASSAGLLACIFSPKCYIILLKPELNNKRQLMRRKFACF